MASYNFRSALGGFNRQDVVNYIEFSNSKHQTAMNQLRTDLANAQEEVEKLRRAPDLQAKCDQQEATIAALQAQIQELTAQLEQQTARRNDEELEIYRRAERMERQAKERSELIYQTANGVLADATAKVDDATAQISGIADQVASQLEALRTAVTGSKQALKDAADVFGKAFE